MAEARRYGANIWKLKLIRVFFWMHFFAGVLIPFYTEWGGLRLSQVLFLNSWFMFWNFVLEVPTGTVADFLGRKVSLICGCVVAALAAFLYVSVPKFSVFLLAEFVFSIAYTLHSGADEALAYDSLAADGRAAKSKSVLSALESCKLAGIVAATIAGGFIAARFGLDAPMRWYILPALVALLLALTLQEPPTGDRERARKQYFTILREGVACFSRNRILRMLTFEISLTNAFAWGIIWLFQPLLMRAGIGIAYFGVVHALSALGQILLLSNVERVEGWVGSKRRLLLLMAGVSGAAFIGLAFLQSAALVVAGIVVAFTFSLPRVPLFVSYMNKYVPSDKRATILSLTSMCRTLAIVVVNLGIGLLADWSLSGALLVLGALLLAATALSRIEERHLID